MRTKRAVQLCTSPPGHHVRNAAAVAIRELREDDRDAVLYLLKQDPVHSVLLAGKVEANGLCHPANRGRFFGYFYDGRLKGVALLGHNILIFSEKSFEADAIKSFALKAIEIKASGHLILGPQAQVEAFWKHLEQLGRQTRLVNEQLWCVCTQPAQSLKLLQLQQANFRELDIVSEAQAEMALEESGIDPRVTDPEGFRQRVSDRISKGYTWVKIQDGKIIFKVELICVTPDTVYIEGVWTHPDYRGQGIALDCLTELTHRLLRQKMALCLMVRSEEKAALRLYEKVGFVFTENYQARFLSPQSVA